MFAGCVFGLSLLYVIPVNMFYHISICPLANAHKILLQKFTVNVLCEIDKVLVVQSRLMFSQTVVCLIVNHNFRNSHFESFCNEKLDDLIYIIVV